MKNCLMCGAVFGADAWLCPACRWPHARAGWSIATWKIRTATLDTGCVNAEKKHHDLNALECLEAEGKVRLQRTAVMLEEIRGGLRTARAGHIAVVPKLFVLGSSTWGSGDVLAGPLLDDEQLRRILFPTTTTAQLSDQQRNDIRHIVLHVRHGGDLFVTLNPKDFIARGKAEQLGSMGIWVMSPCDAGRLIERLWNRWSIQPAVER